MHLDPVLKAGQAIQQNRTGAIIGRHFEAGDAAAEHGSEQPGDFEGLSAPVKVGDTGVTVVIANEVR